MKKRMKLGLAVLTLGLSAISTSGVQAASTDYGNGVHCDEKTCSVNWSETFQQSTDRAIESWATGLTSAPAKAKSAIESNYKSSNDSNRPESGTTTGSPSF
ncbi:leucocin A/sakacin P family class II bacteriocin [Oceanobacillus oncorhynchi]|uniref:leucocin A/sakacin P family class II bacteriocin n=1 Tax=Oceanobacillus oncorhynchi TaxID=545501 RepID=UPI0021163334|nr:leucocin A/sakacin P family class II bacteriocin [Oceanobacillus oncorhynchi]UUI42279.1 class II bacteriocin [Oceanobacillus oncorhynchi]